MFKKIWYSEFLISEDKKIVNNVLKQIKNDKRKDGTLFIHKFLKENKIPFIFLIDILRHHGKYFVITKNFNDYNIRISYYGNNFCDEGGYCVGYYIKQFFTLRFLFDKTRQYISF